MRTRGKLNQRSTADRIYAILEANEPNRMTYEQIALELDERFSYQPKEATIRRAIQRLKEYGLASSVTVPYLDYETSALWGRDDATPWGRSGVFGSTLGYVPKTQMLLGVA